MYIQQYTPQETYVKDLRDQGLATIPLKTDGTKSPNLFEWKSSQQHLPSDPQLEKWFPGALSLGIGIIMGKVSGYCEAIDIDDSAYFELFKQAVTEQGGADILSKLVIVRSPRPGNHLLFKCFEGIEGNQVLARESKTKVLIETRGEGGYLVAVGSAPEVHPSKRPYRFLQGSGYGDIQEISKQEREILFQAARCLNKYVEPEKIITGPRQATFPSNGGGLRPGDDFNQRASWHEILVPAGWTNA